jgi:hypothetical protein
VTEVLFNRPHFSGKDSLHVKSFELPLDNYKLFVNGDNPEESLEELLELINL